jgi:hypothetical protein
MSFLDSLFGIKRIIVNGVELPSRGILTFVGSSVTGQDDPANNQTVITIGTAPLAAKVPAPEGGGHGGL